VRKSAKEKEEAIKKEQEDREKERELELKKARYKMVLGLKGRKGRPKTINPLEPRHFLIEC
jgi:diphthamide synthase subunit DPH2